MAAKVLQRDALRLLEERDKLNQLREDVQRGLERLDQGKHHPFDEQAVQRIKRNGRKQIAAAQRKS